MAWQVDFFTDEHGSAPVEEYLTSLPVQHRAKMLALIKILEQEGPNLPFPYSSQIRGEAEGAAKSTRERQAENFIFRRRAEGVCSPARNRETERNCPRRTFALRRRGWSCMDGEWREERNDDTMEAVLPETDDVSGAARIGGE